MTPRPRKGTSRYEPTTDDGIERDKRSSILHLRDTVYRANNLEPVRVDRSLKTTNMTEARDRAKRIRAKIAAGEDLPNRKTDRHTFAEGFALLEKIQSTKAQKTLVSFYSQSAHLEPFLMGKAIDVGSLSPGSPVTFGRCPYLDDFETAFEEVWADYKLHRDQVTPGRKLKHDRQLLVQLLKRARNKGWISRAFTRLDFDISDVTEPIGKFLEDDQVNMILSGLLDYAADREKRELERIARAAARGEEASLPSYWFPKKDYLQVLIAVTMGMRKREILHLHRDELNLRKREIDLNPKRIKTRRRREVPVPISDAVYPLLKEAAELAPGPYLFPAIMQSKPGHPVNPDKPQDDNRFYWEQVKEDTGIEVRFHDLRHTAVTNMLEAGMPDYAVRKICGVSEVTMRRIYAHIKAKSNDEFRQLFTDRFTGAKK